MKISISMPEEDLVRLKARAVALHDGNLSAAVTAMLHVTEEREARRALAAWLNEPHGPPTKADLDAVRAEWNGERKPKKRTKAA